MRTLNFNEEIFKPIIVFFMINSVEVVKSINILWTTEIIILINPEQTVCIKKKKINKFLRIQKCIHN